MRLVVALLLCLLPTSVAAQEEAHIRWSDSWARTHPASYAAASVGMASTLILDRVIEPNSEPNTRGPWLFDADLRRALRSEGEDDREAAALLSDVLLLGLLAWPVIDSLGVAGLAYGSTDVAWQLTSVAVEVAAADFILNTLIKALVHRERPHGDRCDDDSLVSNPSRCEIRGRTRSFYSGHSSASFASAGNICMAHAFLSLYGDVALDALACGGAILTASMVGILRMLADRHWATDVLVGSLVGLATGLLLPYVLHYGWDLSDSDTAGTGGPLISAPRTFSLGFSF